MFTVGGRLYSMLETSESPTLIRTFDPTSAWEKVLENCPMANEDEERKELKDECYWSYFSPDGSLICFYATREYIIVYDAQSSNLCWCYKLKGKNASDYWVDKPVFHPTLPMMVWVEQFGKDGREDFNARKHCGVYLVNLSRPNANPVRINDLTDNKPLHTLPFMYAYLQQLTAVPISSSLPAAPSPMAAQSAATTTISTSENSSSSRLASTPLRQSSFPASKPSIPSKGLPTAARPTPLSAR